MDREVTPHFDEKKESIINDSLSTSGSKMGIEINADTEFSHEQNPFKQPIKASKSMSQFRELTKGKKVNDKE
ncbi:hypothetical protein [Metabacillus malikii]|uniref:Uncharacterized protein n=1 Tax=Metabacillus malikii TaxID=1504265 RepID=A0ABT9ZEW7_9BACI|nr:hypothetical protein [Metabacillus malikii]MDQ0230376.1 hypothetical protein [Metabacillus malikii]